LQGRDAEAASGFLDEISLLNSLAGHSNIIQLIDSEVGGWVGGRVGGCTANGVRGRLGGTLRGRWQLLLQVVPASKSTAAQPLRPTFAVAVSLSSNIIQCTATVLQVHRSEGLIYMVLEFGDIDLAHLLQVGCGAFVFSGCVFCGDCCIALHALM
jgi:hypothetical protein